MKIVVYGPEKRTGVLTEGQIIDIAGAVGKKGNAEAASLVDLNTLIMGGQAALDVVQTAVANLGEAGDDIICSAEGTALHAPRAQGAERSARAPSPRRAAAIRTGGTPRPPRSPSCSAPPRNRGSSTGVARPPAAQTAPPPPPLLTPRRWSA